MIPLVVCGSLLGYILFVEDCTGWLYGDRLVRLPDFRSRLGLSLTTDKPADTSYQTDYTSRRLCQCCDAKEVSTPCCESSSYYNAIHTRLLCFSSSCCQTKTSAGEMTLSNTSFTALPQVSQFNLLSNAARLDCTRAVYRCSSW